MKICILTIATNKYIQFVERLYDNIHDNFLNGHHIECLLFTEHDVETSDNVRVSQIEHEDWPIPTLKRYNYFVKEKDFISQFDYCYYFDVDMGIIDKVGDEFVIHILYLNGEFEDNNNALGIAYKGSSFAMFQEKIEDAAFLFISAQDIEKAVLVHEYGHLLGLVNMGYTSPHDHEDPDHPHHSNNEESVMYWAIESQDFYNQLDGEPPNNFDSYDLDDLNLMRQGKL